MTDDKMPTTPTGKRQHDLAWSQIGVPVLGDHGNDPEGCSSCRFIKRIEREAAAAERKRLRDAACDYPMVCSHHHLIIPTRLLSEDTP